MKQPSFLGFKVTVGTEPQWNHYSIGMSSVTIQVQQEGQYAIGQASEAARIVNQ